MKRTLFVTTELHPETQGGAGVVVDSLARELSGSQDVAILLLTPHDLSRVDHQGIEVHHATMPKSGFLERSKSAAEAISGLARSGDRVEVQDFEGIGYWALAHRAELGLDEVEMTVRFHGPYDLLAEAMDSLPADWELPRKMETAAFRMADAIVIPVAGHKTTLVTRYGIEPERIFVGAPPVPPIPGVPAFPTSPTAFAVIGRLGEMKGTQDMVSAVLNLRAEGLEVRARFIGGDGWSPTTGQGMAESMRALIGEQYADSFEFSGSTDRSELASALNGVTAVVVPSRFESFCLAAHEARMLGLPVVVPDIPAFQGLFDESTGALTFDPGIEGLTDAIRSLVEDRGRASRLGRSERPLLADPRVPYDREVTIRHPRSQAGLATAATQELELLQNATASGTGALAKVYRRIPRPLARLGVRILPRPLKDRARKHASWAAEEERRFRERRIAALRERMFDSDFEAPDERDISVIIPVFDQVDYLEETIASVFEQTHDSWDIVIVNDGSANPAVADLLDTLECPRIQIITQANRGLPAARNAGVALSRGRYIIPLDSDDELAPSFMATMLRALESNSAAAYAHCYARLFHDID
ncbi:MAG: glycosyltransferase, partial [Acidimicrobiia bacterium]